MEELTEILTWLKLRLHSKPVGILNCGGYYDHFLQWVSLIYLLAIISLKLQYLHCKNRLVVLTAEWLPRLHGLLWYQRLLYKTTSFLVVSSSFLILK